MGPLSRFHKTNDEESPGHLLVILSGPEPQRSIFENKIVRDIAHYNGTATIVRDYQVRQISCLQLTALIFYNHLGAGELNREMNRAGLIISRSGYSTVMDVFQLGKKAVMVATPGQTEQEYLAKYLMNKNFIASLPQNRFSLAGALELAKSFPYAIPGLKQSNLQRLISEFVTVSQPGKARSGVEK
jgi:UDP-N-acetylglucosamine:LPS N-acetylglucosamine transferase